MMKHRQQEEAPVWVAGPGQLQSAAADAPTVRMAETDESARRIEHLKKALRTRKLLLKALAVPIAGIAAAVGDATWQACSGYASGNLLNPWAIGFVLANYAAFGAILVGAVDRPTRALWPLANADDPRAVGALVDALSAGDTACGIAGSVLIRLLPRMRAADMALLTPAQRAGLRRTLLRAANPRSISRHNPALALAILDCIARAGARDDLPLLALLAKGRTQGGEREGIRRAAQAASIRLETALAGATLGEETDQNELSVASTVSPADATRFAELLGRLAPVRRRDIEITAVSALGATAAACGTMFYSHGAQPAPPPVVAALLASAACMCYFGMRGMHAQRKAAQALMHVTDMSAVVPLLETAATAEVSGAIAAIALTPLLLRLRASDSCLLDGSTRENLNRALSTHRKNTHFALAALAALQQVGDGEAIQIVQRLSERPARTAATRAVCTAARECLPFLQQRAAAAEANATLLRAADAASTPPETLLRPTRGGAGGSERDMVRSADAPPAPLADEQTSRPASLFQCAVAATGA